MNWRSDSDHAVCHPQPGRETGHANEIDTHLDEFARVRLAQVRRCQTIELRVELESGVRLCLVQGDLEVDEIARPGDGLVGDEEGPHGHVRLGGGNRRVPRLGRLC
jgi:hypothetical protein